MLGKEEKSRRVHG